MPLYLLDTSLHSFPCHASQRQQIGDSGRVKAYVSYGGPSVLFPGLFTGRVKTRGSDRVGSGRVGSGLVGSGKGDPTRSNL